MHQFRAEDLKALLDLLDLVADLFFDVGSFVNLVTDVNVHFSRLERGKRSPVKLRPYEGIVHPERRRESEVSARLPFLFRGLIYVLISRRRNPSSIPWASRPGRAGTRAKCL